MLRQIPIKARQTIIRKWQILIGKRQTLIRICQEITFLKQTRSMIDLVEIISFSNNILLGGFILSFQKN